MKDLFTISLALLMILTATANASPQEAASRYDGETVFRGVLLNDGPVAKLFPEFWESAQLATYRKLAAERGSEQQAALARQKVIDMLRAQDPTFFNRFGIEMQSGDPLRIQEAITEAGSRLQKEVSSKLLTASAGPDAPIDLDVATKIEYYYYVAAAAVVVIVIAGALVVTLVAADPTNSNSNLLRDEYVGQIAQRLGPVAIR